MNIMRRIRNVISSGIGHGLRVTCIDCRDSVKGVSVEEINKFCDFHDKQRHRTFIQPNTYFSRS